MSEFKAEINLSIAQHRLVRDITRSMNLDGMTLRLNQEQLKEFTDAVYKLRTPKLTEFRSRDALLDQLVAKQKLFRTIERK